MNKLLIIALLFFTVNTFAQKGEVEWLDIEKAEELNKTTPKKMIVFIETDWCGYCKQMDKTIFKDETIAAYMNENFYPVRFNGEQKEPVTFDGIDYEFVTPEGARGAHQFAIDLLQGRLAYPGLVILENDFDMINVFQGMQPKELFEKYLVYVTEDAYLTQDWFEWSGQTVSKE